MDDAALSVEVSPELTALGGSRVPFLSLSAGELRGFCVDSVAAKAGNSVGLTCPVVADGPRPDQHSEEEARRQRRGTAYCENEEKECGVRPCPT